MRSWHLSLALALFGLTACSSADVSIAEAQIPLFHASLDAAEFQKIYSNSSEDFKKATTERDFVALLEAVHRRLGATKSSEKKNWNINVHTSGTFVTLTYKTSFTDGDASEQFVYRMIDDHAQLVGYHISSNALILK